MRIILSVNSRLTYKVIFYNKNNILFIIVIKGRGDREMFSALDRSGKLIDVDIAIKNPDSKYYCRSCGGELIIKKGNVRIKHFAHKNKCTCDDYHENMSEWHRYWQKKFPIRNREVPLKIDDSILQTSFIECLKKTERRADILCYGYVIEFQNSPITSKEFNERTWFYNALGKKVVWIFNMIEEYKNEKIQLIEERYNKGDNGGKYSWKYASKTFINYDSYDNDVILIFQVAEVDNKETDIEQGYFERVIWAINSNNDKDTNFKRFFTSYYPGNFTELMQKIQAREL